MRDLQARHCQFVCTDLKHSLQTPNCLGRFEYGHILEPSKDGFLWDDNAPFVFGLEHMSGLTKAHPLTNGEPFLSCHLLNRNCHPYNSFAHPLVNRANRHLLEPLPLHELSFLDRLAPLIEEHRNRKDLLDKTHHAASSRDDKGLAI